MSDASTPSTGEILRGLWRFVAVHPDWTEDEGGEEGWDPSVAWWAVGTDHGLLLIDPLVEDWEALDALVGASGGCAAILRTCHWHERSIAEASRRYGSEVWAALAADGRPRGRLDRALSPREELLDGAQACVVERDDEIAVWLPEQRALVFGDAMIRTADGDLSMCPETWTQPAGGRARLRELLGDLAVLPVEHALVSHGPLVLGDGAAALAAALSA